MHYIIAVRWLIVILFNIINIGLVFAEGIIDVNPYASLNTIYDDNVFRFSNSNQAEARFGSRATSDRIIRKEIGVDMNLRLSRQLVSLSAAINQNEYDRFTLLDNIGKSYGLNWDWRLGNDLFGAIGKNESESLAGFNELRTTARNIRSINREYFITNWQFQPNWSVRGSYEIAKSDNSERSFDFLNRESHIYDAGLQYANFAGTQLGVSYRNFYSEFPDRTGFATFAFGNENTQQELIINFAWLPTIKSRISARLSGVELNYQDVAGRNFSGFNQRWNFDHSLTANTLFNITAYKEISAIDDVLASYVKMTGFGVNSKWNPTEKVSLNAGLGFEERDYLGAAGLSNFGFVNQSGADRLDESKFANITLSYLPNSKSRLELSYTGERRTSNETFLNYNFNSLRAFFRYSF